MRSPFLAASNKVSSRSRAEVEADLAIGHPGVRWEVAVDDESDGLDPRLLDFVNPGPLGAGGGDGPLFPVLRPLYAWSCARGWGGWSAW